MSIVENIARIKAELGSEVALVAVSKYRPDEAVQEAYAAGHRHFGENKAQAVRKRAKSMPEDIRWHFIGHLQRNKVKEIAPFIRLIHSVDSMRLLEEIDKQASKVPRIIDCLLQIYIAKEESKFGLSEEEAVELLQSSKLEDMAHVRIVGIMGMATNTKNTDTVRREFAGLKIFYEKLKTFSSEATAPEEDGPPFPPNVQLSILSMGMSADYHIASEEGSTMVRIGSAVFS
jgi:hypothetical protein